MLIEDIKNKTSEISETLSYIKECLWLFKTYWTAKHTKTVNRRCRFLA